MGHPGSILILYYLYAFFSVGRYQDMIVPYLWKRLKTGIVELAWLLRNNATSGADRG